MPTHASRKQKKEVLVFKAMLALKTEVPTQVGQAPHVWNIAQKATTSQESRGRLHRTRNSHRKAFLYSLSHTPPQGLFIKRFPGKLAYVT